MHLYNCIGKKEYNQVRRYMDITGINEAYIVNVNYDAWEVKKVEEGV